MGAFTRLLDSRNYQLAICFAVFIAFWVVKLHALQQKHPLADADKHSSPWSHAWLRFAALENYATSCTLGAVAYYTESRRSRARAALWLAACVLLGAPCCCLFVALRLRDHGTLGLEDRGDGGGGLPGRRPSK